MEKKTYESLYHRYKLKNPCSECGGEYAVTVETNWIESYGESGLACEADLECEGCRTLVNSWAYGHWHTSLQEVATPVHLLGNGV